MTLDPVTRAACAEALASATAETLREDARLLLDVFRDVPPTTREDAAWVRAAALALAVAAWSERPHSLGFVDGDWDDSEDASPTVWERRIPGTMQYDTHPTLPAALAHLIREGA